MTFANPDSPDGGSLAMSLATLPFLILHPFQLIVAGIVSSRLKGAFFFFFFFFFFLKKKKTTFL